MRPSRPPSLSLPGLGDVRRRHLYDEALERQRQEAPAWLQALLIGLLLHVPRKKLERLCELTDLMLGGGIFIEAKLGPDKAKDKIIQQFQRVHGRLGQGCSTLGLKIHGRVVWHALEELPNSWKAGARAGWLRSKLPGLLREMSHGAWCGRGCGKLKSVPPIATLKQWARLSRRQLMVAIVGYHHDRKISTVEDRLERKLNL